jgi:hypothetical protein
MKLLGLLVAVLAVPAAALATEAVESPHPEPVQPCTRWTGTVRGNDPSVAVVATLCSAGGGRVRGTLVWSSRRSGSSVRTIEGAWAAGELIVHDTALSGRPNPGWRFCTIDRYTLRPSADRLDGTYTSLRCNDDATIALVRAR